MKKTIFFSLLFVTLSLPKGNLFGQYKSDLKKEQWVDSVFNSLSNEEKIAQLMVVRAHSNLGPDHVASVVNDIKKYNVGALCFFQGGPIRQANLTNVLSVAKVHVEDLWLAHAAGQGDAAAIGTIERAHVHGSAAGRLRGQRFSPDEIAEIEQNLREHLFVAKPGERPKIAQYAGRGELSGWIGVSATRAALRARKKTEREVSESGVISRAVADGDVELAFVKEAYRPAFKEAFHEALASLDAKERLLLRQHAVEGLGIDALGELYGVHRARAARWVAKVREAVLDRTRIAFEKRMNVGRAECRSPIRSLSSRSSARRWRIGTSSGPFGFARRWRSR